MFSTVRSFNWAMRAHVTSLKFIEQVMQTNQSGGIGTACSNKRCWKANVVFMMDGMDWMLFSISGVCLSLFPRCHFACHVRVQYLEIQRDAKIVENSA